MAIRHLGANSRGADMTQSQSKKYAKHNDHIDLVLDATQQKKNIIIDDPNTSIPVEDWTENNVFHLRAAAGSPNVSEDFVLTVPSTQRRFAIFNDVGYTCHLRTAESPGEEVEIPDGGRADLHCDGESIVELKRDIYDIGFFSGTFTEGNIFGAFVCVRPFTLLASLPNSRAYAFTAPDEAPSISIQKNEIEAGTVDFTPGTKAGTFTFASNTSFVSGDRLRLVNTGSSPTETTMANIAITLRGVLD